MKYTEMETKVIEQFGQFLNYEDLESNLDDNATAFWLDEIVDATGIEPKVMRGVLSSLEKKNLIYADDVNGDPMFRVDYGGLVEYYRMKGNVDPNILKYMDDKTNYFDIYGYESGE